MFYDANYLPNDAVLQAQVCIVGAGPAGLSIARTLGKAGVSVCLLEAGGMEPEPAAAELAKVELGGDSCFDPSQRRTFAFGGTTWMWSGWCRPFDPIDFEYRSWVPDSGWPLEYAELHSYYARASDFLGLKESNFALSSLPTDDDRVPWHLKNPELESKLFRVIRPSPRLGLLYKDAFEKFAQVSVYTHAYVQHLDFDAERGRVSGAQCTDASGRPFTVQAERLVLAAGGIDNPRLLLQTQQVFSARGLQLPAATGKYFMLRLHARGGKARKGRDRKLNTNLYHHNQDGAVARVFTSEAGQRLHQSLRYNLSFYPARALWSTTAPATLLLGGASMNRRHFLVGSTAALAVAGASSCARSDHIFNLFHTAEQSPFLESRIELAQKTNALQGPLARVIWKTQTLDQQSFYGSARRTSTDLSRWGGLHIDLDGFAATGMSWPPSDRQGAPGHYMGTTRMGVDPARSVVDVNSRVHGLPNLYVAGCSVFPTAGNGTPTLTMVALALRLADHLLKGSS